MKDERDERPSRVQFQVRDHVTMEVDESSPSEKKVKVFTIDLDDEITSSTTSTNKNDLVNSIGAGSSSDVAADAEKQQQASGEQVKNGNKKRRKSSKKMEDEFMFYRHHRSSNIIFQIWIKAKNVSDNPVNFIRNLYDIVSNSVGFICILSALTLIPVVMIVIGALNIDNCPIESNIPLWLIVFGCVGSFNCICRIAVSIYIYIKSRPTKALLREPILYTYFYGLLCTFMAIWFLIGNAWVFSVRPRVQFDNMDSPAYCNTVCYLLAFWVIVFYWILFFLLLLIVIGVPVYFFIIFLVHKYLLKDRNRL